MTPEVDTFLIFDGNCREAIAFYTKVFDIDPNTVRVTTYGEMDPSLIKEEGRDKITLGEVSILGHKFYMADYTKFSSIPYVLGTNVMLALALHDSAQLNKLFNELKVQGSVIAEIRKTEFTEMLGIVKDQFGVIWELFLSPKGAG